MSVDLKKITTEGRNKNSLDIDQLDTIGILKKINEEDKIVPSVVANEIEKIALLVDDIVKCFEKGGRLIYVGAGTSGRMGLIDAVECRPTFNCDPEMIQCIMAGGEGAMVKAVEGAEDNRQMAIEQLKDIQLNANDCVVGIAASGRTPYTISAIEYANSLGCVTGCITTSKNSKLASVSKYPIEAITGPEVLMGSTRMKSGTAQKLICNMISCAAMIKMGRVYSNLLIDMRITNEKIVERSKNVLVEALGISMEEAALLIEKYGDIKCALLGALSENDDVDKVKKIMKETNGNIRKALEIIKEK